MADKNKYSSLSFSFLDEEEDSLPGVMDLASHENADQYASNLTLANETGLSVDAVATDPISVKNKYESIDFSQMSTRSPNTSEFLVDYNNAAIVQDDVGILEKLESWFNPANTFENFGATTKLGFEQQAEAAILAGGDSLSTELDNLIPSGALPFGVPDSYRHQMSRQFASNLGINSDEELAAAKEQGVQDSITRITEIKEERAALTPDDLTWIEEGVRGGAESLVQNSPGFGMMLAGGGRGAMLSTMAAQVGLTGYAEGRSEGLTPLQAGSYAAIDSAIEVATELAPLDTLGKILTGEKSGAMTKAVARFMMQEMVGEQAATVLQSANAYLFGLDEELANASNAGEVADIMGRRAAVTAVATVVAGGTQSGVVAGIRYGIETLAGEQENQQSVTAVEQQRLKELNSLATDSKTRERSPETFSEFLKQNDAGQDSQVYIDTTQAALYLQENRDQVDKDPSLELLQQKVQEASKNGTDVSMSIEEFGTSIAGTSHFENLKESTTLSAEGVSPFRQDQVREETSNFVKGLMAEAEENVSEYVQAQEIYTTIRDQLIDTGQVNPKAASVMAQLVPAWATVYAKKNGVSVEEAFAASGLTVEGPQTGENARLENEKSLLQRAKDAVFGETQVEAEPEVSPRLQRARDQGFDTENILYHGTVKFGYTQDIDIKQFDTDKIGDRFHADREGFFFINDTEIASDYAQFNSIGTRVNEGAVYPVYLKKSKPLIVDLNNPIVAKERNEDTGVLQDPLLREGVISFWDSYNEEIMQVYKAGDYDSVIVADETGQEMTVIFDPENIRSVNAQFNDISSADILAQAPVNGLTFSQETDNKAFSTAISAAKANNPKGAFVYQYPEENYQDMQMYTSDDGKVGFAINEGDLVSVFKHPDSSMRGAMNEIIPLAISLGATKLDAFEGFLTDSYSKFGFVEVGRAEFSDEFAPPDWNYEVDGRPDVVFMELAPEAIQARDNGVFNEILKQDSQTAEREADGSLKGLPRQIENYDPKNDPTIEAAARAYMEAAGLDYNPPNIYAPIDPGRAARIATAYDRMAHTPQDEQVKAAYDQLITETIAQYEAALDAGLQVEFIDFEKQGDPYAATPREAVKDITENQHMWVFSTRDGFGSDDTFDPADNPLLQETEFKISGQTALVNDLFRVVHDYFGHAKEGLGFRATGEENAWRSHSAMFSPLARKAMTSETRGQNSWVNFGPESEFNKTASAEDTIYADQKVGLLPDWAVEQGATDSELLAQKNDTTARGYYDPNNVTIRLTEAADLSTFLHEFGHFMFEMEKKSSSGSFSEINSWFERNSSDVAFESTQFLNDEYGIEGSISEADVKAYLNTGMSGNLDFDRAISRATHEQFARGFEAYLMEGKAPSVELRNIFRTMAQWLSRIYNSLRGDLRVNLDQGARDFFGALIATDEQIEAAKARGKVGALFTDAEMAGMTDEQFAEYQNTKESVTEKAQETLRDKLVKNITRQTKAWWKNEKADLIDEKTNELKETQIYKALEALRNGEVKLDRAAIKEMVGIEKKSKLGNKYTAMPNVFNGLTITGGEGLQPDDAAAFFGYDSGSELLDVMINTPPLKTAAIDAAQAEMLERHGDILNDGTIELEADEALLSEERATLILAELKVLAKGGSIPKFDKQMIKDFAAENIANLSFRQINPAKHRRAADRAQLEAGRMLEAGNREGAAQAKLRQLTQFYLEKAAVEAKDNTLKIVDKMNRYNRKSVREEIMKAEGGYWEQIVGILGRFEFRKAASLKSVDQANQSLNAWVKDRIDNHGDGLMLSNSVLVEGFSTHWKNVVHSDLIGISDSVQNIEHVARYSNKMQGMQEEIDFKTLVNKWTTSIYDKVKTVYNPQRTTTTDKRNIGKWANGQMTKIPFLTSWLDGGERVGLSHEILMRPFNEALDNEFKLFKEVGLPIVEAMNNRTKKDVKRHNTKIFIPEIKDATNDGNLMGHQIVAVALNTGNQSNLRKLLLGEKWATEEQPETVTFENEKLQAVLKHMSKSDWELVQSIWTQMELLYPQLAEVHRKTTGLTPPKVDASPFSVTVEGQEIKMDGGYYPVKYDPARSDRAAVNQERQDAQADSMFGDTGSIQASVNASSTNERTGFYDSIDLNLGIVPNHFQETIHFITHHDAVRQTNKLIRNSEVKKAIKATLGPEEYKNLIPWLNDIAKDGRESANKGFVDWFFKKMRFGVTLGTMGFKASTGLIQTSGLSNSIAEVGQKNMLQAMRMILGSENSIKEGWDFAVENSKVLEHRLQTMDREMRTALESLEGKKGYMAAVQEASMKHIAFIQLYTVDLPSWYAGYLKELGNSGDERKAFEYADWVIENVQGSGATKDMSTMLRNQSATHRIFTMFMTFFSSAWNMQRDVARGYKSGKHSVSTVAAKAMFLITIPVLYEMVMRGTMFTDGDDDGDEELNTQGMLTNLALFPIQGIPVLRDMASGTIGDFGYNMSPVASIIERGVTAAPEIFKRSTGLSDKEITAGQVEATAKLVGAFLGVPGMNQVWATGEHLEEVMVQGEDFTMRELAFGPDRD
jgi:hypothetical protein